MLMKKALKGDLPLMQAAKALQVRNHEPVDERA
jgi:hypothetical protein